MFKIKRGKTKVQQLQVTVSTEIAAGSLVAWDSGELIAASATSKPYDIAGVLVKAITSDDDDYADARLVGVEVPMEPYTEWEAPVTSGLVAADKGLYQDITDAVTVNRAASTLDVVQCIKVISRTKGIFHLNIGIFGMGVIAD